MVSMTPAQQEMISKHGTPQAFRNAVWAACCQLFVTVDEYHESSDKYDTEFAAAGGNPCALCHGVGQLAARVQRITPDGRVCADEMVACPDCCAPTPGEKS
jgi:hypothetical protein